MSVKKESENKRLKVLKYMLQATIVYDIIKL